MLVFPTLQEAVNAGFQLYERTPTQIIVRKRINDRWQMAFVDIADEVKPS